MTEMDKSELRDLILTARDARICLTKIPTEKLGGLAIDVQRQVDQFDAFIARAERLLKRAQ